MGLETYFKIFAIDNTGKRKHSKEEIEKLWKDERDHDPTMVAYDKEFYTKQCHKVPPFLVVRNPPDMDSKKYKYLPSQKEDPFPVWIDTATGNEAYEIMNVNFLSDFDELYKYYHLEGCNDCCEVPVKDVQDMLVVLKYILRGKYDRDVEDMMFENNDFFKVLENQFFNFKMRFRRKKKNCKTQQTICIIVKDNRSDVESDDGCDDPSKDDWELIEERLEYEKEECGQIERLKNVLNSFLYMKESDYDNNPKVVYKLGYFLSV